MNCPVHDASGRLLGIADLLDVEAGLVIEFHGADHRRARRQTADVRKEERLRGVGLEVTGVTGLELPDRELVVRRLLVARSRAMFLPPSERLWMPRPPADDLHQRLLELAVRRALFEAHEATPLPDIREMQRLVTEYRAVRTPLAGVSRADPGVLAQFPRPAGETDTGRALSHPPPIVEA